MQRLNWVPSFIVSIWRKVAAKGSILLVSTIQKALYNWALATHIWTFHICYKNVKKIED